MALVPYDYSDSDEDYEEMKCKNTNISKSKQENEIKIVKKANHDKKKKTVKINIPDITFDEDDLPSKIKKPKFFSDSDDLISLLPSPENSASEKTVRKPPNESLEKNGDRSKFGYVKSESALKQETNNTEAVKVTKRKYIADLVSNATFEGDVMKKKHTEFVLGNRKKRKAYDQNFEVIDVNVADMVSKEWMNETLNEEKHVPVSEMDDEISVRHKRKHQITYLAYQAKVNEHQLKNQWALNKMTRKQTQAKYGF